MVSELHLRCKFVKRRAYFNYFTFQNKWQIDGVSAHFFYAYRFNFEAALATLAAHLRDPDSEKK